MLRSLSDRLPALDPERKPDARRDRREGLHSTEWRREFAGRERPLGLLWGTSKDVREEDGLRIDKDGRGEGEASPDMLVWIRGVEVEVETLIEPRSALPEALIQSRETLLVEAN